MKDCYSVLMSPWHQKGTDVDASKPVASVAAPLYFSQSSPQTVIAAAYLKMLDELSSELLGYVYAQSHQAFEHLVLDVMLAMGYGDRRRDLVHRVGRSGDGDIDCVIEMDELGLDIIYMQAKRLKPSSRIAVSTVRDFVGSLESRHATKGIFVTTAEFTPATIGFVGSISKKVVLINGPQLARLMIRHNIGIVPLETLQFKKVDLNYFINSSGVKMSSASNHPRR